MVSSEYLATPQCQRNKTNTIQDFLLSTVHQTRCSGSFITESDLGPSIRDLGADLLPCKFQKSEILMQKNPRERIQWHFRDSVCPRELFLGDCVQQTLLSLILWIYTFMASDNCWKPGICRQIPVRTFFLAGELKEKRKGKLFILEHLIRCQYWGSKSFI